MNKCKHSAEHAKPLSTRYGRGLIPGTVKLETSYMPRSLETFAVHDPRAGLVVLVLGDPHLLEGGERGQDGPADPDRVLALRRGDDLHLDGRRGEGGDLLVEALVDAREHGGAAGQNGVRVEVAADIDVALLDRVVRELVDARGLLADQARLEEGLAAPEALRADRYDLTVGQLVLLLELRVPVGSRQLGV